MGTLTTSSSLTNISQAFYFCKLLNEIELTECVSITNTTNAFAGCPALRRLVLPNLTRGFNISETQITGTNLQDLFTSLGTASGAQTITLPTFTTGEDTTIATGKGYTIAYA
jgi:hypothetical protein